jgi:hypothetical protein
MRRLAAALLAALAVNAPAMAQEPAVTSPAPDTVALTVYRAPDGKGAIDLRALGGFALVSETRRVRLPRGAAVLRFEGVAAGIVPVSAVIDGLPGGVVEKNRDARLLSPAALVDGTLGRQVTLTRTSRATGRRTSETATIVAGPRRGIVLETSSGIETLRCSGLPEALSFAEVPAGLSSKPVLSVATVSPVASTVTIRLSYLASGFDWRASYVATMAADGRTLDLSAWLTLANGNPERFADAAVSAVAGRLNRVATRTLQAAVGALSLSCYPLGTTTSDLREQRFEMADDIVVTGSRVFAPAMMMAPPPAPLPAPPPPPPPEDLGDLKLYRVPERLALSPRGQKQVALLARAAVPFTRSYRRRVGAGQTLEPSPMAIVLVVQNRKDTGLGLPLPSGSSAAYALQRSGEPLLLGLGELTDRTEGETVRIAAGTSTQVLIEQRIDTATHAVVTVTNAAPFAVGIEVPIGAAGQAVTWDDAAMARVDGVATWSTMVPAGGRAELRYRF